MLVSCSSRHMPSLSNFVKYNDIYRMRYFNIKDQENLALSNFLYRVPCRIGICTSPIELTSSQLIASEIFPAVVVKTLLYPGAIANAIIMRTSIPSYNNLLSAYNFINVKQAPSTTDIQYLEVGMFGLALL